MITLLKEGELIFNSKSNLDLNLKLQEYPSIPRTNEDYEEVPIERRNGNLIVNKGTYPNKVIPFVFTKTSDNLHISLDEVEEWLLNVEDNRLMWGREDRCHRVKKIIFGDFRQEFKTFGSIEVTFICEPFMEDLNSTSIVITKNNFNVVCDGNMGAETLFKLYGNGNVQLTVDGETMTINNVSNYVEIDSKRMQVRDQGGNSKDNDTTGNFITLTKGFNTISWVGNVIKIELEFTNQYR